MSSFISLLYLQSVGKMYA